MSRVNVTNIILTNQQEPFLKPISLSIYFDVLSPLQGPIEWRAIYVGSADSIEYDQILGYLSVPIDQPGEKQFEWSIRAPDPRLIPSLDDLLGASVLMISAQFLSQEFFRCSYFVYNNCKEEV